MSTSSNETDISGMLGESVSVRKVGSRVVVKNRPPKKVGKPSEKQETAQEKFQDAAQYARQQVAVPESKALYTTGLTTKKRTPYIVAMTDYLSAPKVRSIDPINYRGTVGDAIVVNAKDDFMVTKVKITITSAAGVLVEEGDAGPDTTKSNQWAYKATAANPTLTGTTIKAVAYDRPGNTGTAQVVL